MPTASVPAPISAASRRRLFGQSALCGAAAVALASPALAGGAGPINVTQTASGANLTTAGSSGTLSAKTSSGTGGASYTVSAGGTSATITLGQPRTLIDWTTYDVGAGGKLTYDFGSAAGAAADVVINRVLTGTITVEAGGTVAGQYETGANTVTGGNIWFLAPGGVFLHGTVTASGVLASNNVSIPDITLLDTNKGLDSLKQQLASYQSTAYSVVDISGTTVTATGVEIDAAGNINLTTANEPTTTSSITTASGDASDQVSLTSTGNITQLSSGVISTSTFTGSSVGATSLPGANLIGTLATFDAGSGFSLTNAQALTVTGTVEAGTGGTSGDLAITLTTGALSGTATLEALGDIALSAAGDIAFGSAAAGDDIVIRTAGALTVTGSLTSGVNPYDTTPTAGTDTGATGAGDVLATAQPLTLFGKTVDADLTAGGSIDVSAKTVDISGTVTAGLTGVTTGDTVLILATGPDAIPVSALTIGGAVSATQDIGLDASSSTGGGSVSAGALTAGRDIAVRSVDGAITLASASAGDDVVLRADSGALSVTGAVTAGTTGAVVDGAGAGLGDTLAALSPLTLFGKVVDASITAGGEVDIQGQSVAITGAVTAGATATTADNVWVLATGVDGGSAALTIGGTVGATQDVGLDSTGGSVSAGALTAGEDIAVRSVPGNITLGAASAGDDLVLRATAGALEVTGKIAAGTTGAVVDGAGAGLGDTLAALSPLTLFGRTFDTPTALEAGGNIDIWSRQVTVLGSATAGAPGTSADNLWVLATGADGPSEALRITGAVTATQDVGLDSTGGSINIGGAMSAGRDIAASAESGYLDIVGASAGDDLVLRAYGSVDVVGSLATTNTASVAADADTTATGDVLNAQTTVFTDGIALGLVKASTISAIAGIAPNGTPGNSDAFVSISGSATAAGAPSGVYTGSDVLITAPGAVTLDGGGSAGFNLYLSGSTVQTGQLVDVGAPLTAGGIVYVNSSLGSVQIVSAVGGYGVAISAANTVDVTGTGVSLESLGTLYEGGAGAAPDMTVFGHTYAIDTNPHVQVTAGGDITIAGLSEAIGPGGTDVRLQSVGGAITTGAITANQDIVIDADLGVQTGATIDPYQAGRDIAVRSSTANITLASASAGDDLVLRATSGSVSAAGALSAGTTGAVVDAAGAGAGDSLAALSPLTLFGKVVDTSLTAGGQIDIQGKSVAITGAVSAGVTPTTADNVWILATGADGASPALTIGGAVSATQDVGLDATGGSVSAGAVTAGEDVAVRSIPANVTLASASAADDVVLRATSGALSVTGAVSAGTTGAVVDAAGAGLGDTLAALSPLTLFGKVVDTSLTAGGDVDIQGVSVNIAGSVKAGLAPTTADNVWVLATGADGGSAALTIGGAVSATQDVGLDATFGSVSAGAVTAGEDIAVRSVPANVTLASASAGDDVVLRATSGALSVTGAVSAGTTGAVVDDAGAGLGDTLAALSPLTLFGKVVDTSLTAGGDVDIQGVSVNITGSVKAGLAPTTADNVWVLATGADGVSAALTIGGAVSATLDVGLDATGGSVSAGAVSAGEDIAVRSVPGAITLASASASDDVVLRATRGALSVTGAVNAGTTGAVVDSAGAGLGDVLAALSPLTLFGHTFDTPTVLEAGGNVDAWGKTVSLAAVAAGATGTSADNAWVLASGADTSSSALSIAGAVSATLDVGLDSTGGGIAVGGALTAGRDIAASAEGGSLSLASATAGDDIVLRAFGSIVATGSLATTDSASAAADADTGATGDVLNGQTTVVTDGVALGLVKASTISAMAGITTAGTTGNPDASVSIGGAATAVGAFSGAYAGSDVLVTAPGAVTLSGGGSAGYDLYLSGSSVETGQAVSAGAALSAGGIVYVDSALGNVELVSATGAYGVAINAATTVDVTATGTSLASLGTLSEGGAGSAPDMTVFGHTYATDANPHVQVTAGGNITIAGLSEAIGPAGTDVRLQSSGGAITTGAITANQDIVVDAALGVQTGATSDLYQAGRDIAVRSSTANIALGSVSAGDDVVLRATSGSVAVAGTLSAGTTGSVVDSGGAGAGDTLAALSPLTLFGSVIDPSLEAGGNVDVGGQTVDLAGPVSAGVTSSGASATKADGVWVLATGADGAAKALVVGAVEATQDIALEASDTSAAGSIQAGALQAGRDVAVYSADGSITLASAAAAHFGGVVGSVILAAPYGPVDVTGALSAPTTPGADAPGSAGDTLFADVIASSSLYNPSTLFALTANKNALFIASGGETTVGGTATADQVGLEFTNAAAVSIGTLPTSITTPAAGLTAASLANVATPTLSIFAASTASAAPTLWVGTGKVGAASNAVGSLDLYGAGRVEIVGTLTAYATTTNLTIGSMSETTPNWTPSSIWIVNNARSDNAIPSSATTIASGTPGAGTDVDGSIGGGAASGGTQLTSSVPSPFGTVTLLAGSGGIYMGSLEFITLYSGTSETPASINPARPSPEYSSIGSTSPVLVAAANNILLGANGSPIVQENTNGLEAGTLGSGLYVGTGTITVGATGFTPQLVDLFGFTTGTTNIYGQTLSVSARIVVAGTPTAVERGLYRINSCVIGSLGDCTPTSLPTLNFLPSTLTPPEILSQPLDVEDPTVIVAPNEEIWRKTEGQQ